MNYLDTRQKRQIKLLNKENLNQRNSLIDKDIIKNYLNNIYNNVQLLDIWETAADKINNEFSKYKPAVFIHLTDTYESILTGETLYNNCNSNMSNDEIADYAIKQAPRSGEYLIKNMLYHIFPNDIDSIIKEPNGVNTFPDFQVIFKNKQTLNIEIKSVLTSYDSDKKRLIINYNNGANAENIVVSYYKTCKNYINTQTHNIDITKFKHDANINKQVKETETFFETLTVILYYIPDVYNKKIIYYDVDIIPFALLPAFKIDKYGQLIYEDNNLRCQLRSEGTNSFNNNVNVKPCLPKPFNKFNKLDDLISLVLYGKTTYDSTYLYNNNEYNLLNSIQLFNNKLKYINVLKIDETTDIIDVYNSILKISKSCLIHKEFKDMRTEFPKQYKDYIRNCKKIIKQLKKTA